MKIIFLFFIFVSCLYRKTPDNFISVDGEFGKIIVVDSCEYIVFRNSLTHKGNCSFCLKRDSVLHSHKTFFGIPLNYGK